MTNNSATKYEYRLRYVLSNGQTRIMATPASCLQEALDNFYDIFVAYDNVRDCYVCPITDQPIVDVRDPILVDISKTPHKA